VLESADEVIQIGPLVLAKNPVYGSQENVLFQGQNEAPRWYLKSRRIIEDKMGAKATSDQLLGMLRKNGVSEEELYWSGLEELLGSKDFVTKQEALAAIDNGIKVEEVTLGKQPKQYSSINRQQLIDAYIDEIGYDPEEGDPESISTEDIRAALEENASESEDSEMPKYSKYTLPGGGNYKELLLTIPIKTEMRPVVKPSDLVEARQDIYGDKRWHLVSATGNWQDEAYDTKEEAEANLTKPSMQAFVAEGSIYSSSHWDENNVIAHLRFNERTDADGKRVMFIEEIQSDWHQEGRKEGYKNKENTAPEATQEQRDKLSQELKEWTESQGIPFRSADEIIPRNQEQADWLKDWIERWDETEMGGFPVPDAPFKKSWPMLAMKRAIQYAAENGFDRIAWANGKQQANRYKLSSEVDSVDWKKSKGDKVVTIDTKKGMQFVLTLDSDGNVYDSLGEARGEAFEGKHISEIVGEAVATEIMRDTNGNLSGDGLDIGGSGMKAFYDKILPNETNKLIKKFGARVETLDVLVEDLVTYDQVQAAERRRDFAEAERLSEIFERQELGRGDESVRGSSSASKQSGFDITPEMRKSAIQNGQSLFQKKQQQGNVKGWTKFISATRAIIGATKEADISTVIHEFAHSCQRFISMRYEAASEKHGYNNNPFEVEARKIAKENRTACLNHLQKVFG
jgi:hypothetical protein